MNRRLRTQTSLRGSGRGTGASQGPSGFQVLAGWVARVARFDFTVFDDVRAEPTATASAILVVVIASLFAGIGSWLWAVQQDFEGFNTTDVFLRTVIGGTVVQTLIFFAWVYLTHLLLVRAFGAEVLFQELIRVIGLAFAPVALSIFVAVTPLAVPFGVLSLATAFLFSYVAIQQTAGVTTREAVIADLGGFAAFLIFMGAFANVWEVDDLGGLAPGILYFALDF